MARYAHAPPDLLRPRSNAQAAPKRFALTVLCRLCVAWLPTQEPHPYAAVFFEDGLPDFQPLSRIALAEPRYATIPVTEAGRSIQFIWGEQDHKSVCWFLHTRPDSTITLGKIALTENKNESLTANVALRFNSKSTALTPLEMKLLPAERKLLYRWSASPAGTIAGGIPTEKSAPIQLQKTAPDFTVTTLSGRSDIHKEIEAVLRAVADEP